MLILAVYMDIPSRFEILVVFVFDYNWLQFLLFSSLHLWFTYSHLVILQMKTWLEYHRICCIELQRSRIFWWLLQHAESPFNPEEGLWYLKYNFLWKMYSHYVLWVFGSAFLYLEKEPNTRFEIGNGNQETFTR